MTTIRIPLEDDTYSMIVLRVAVRLVELDMRRKRVLYTEGFEKPLLELENKLYDNGFRSCSWQFQLIKMELRKKVRLLDIVDGVRNSRIVIREYQRSARRGLK